MSDVSIDLRGMPEVQAMLDQLSPRQAENRMRRAMRAAAKPMREEIRRKASAGKFPRSMRATRTRAHRHPFGVSVSPKSPLSNIFEHGAKRHAIGAAGKFLSNFEGRRQAAGAFRGGILAARGPVMHPGMGARPLIGPAFDAAKDRAEKAFADKFMEGIR